MMFVDFWLDSRIIRLGRRYPIGVFVFVQMMMMMMAVIQRSEKTSLLVFFRLGGISKFALDASCCSECHQ